jgi:hypothetical protein|nr:MAG TPA: transmembrane domain protein [Caudoviricetes sp.]
MKDGLLFLGVFFIAISIPKLIMALYWKRRSKE